MGGLFSKSKGAKVSPSDPNGSFRNTGSAPARLENLDGTTHPSQTEKRDSPIVVQEHKARAASADSTFNAGPLDTKPTVKKIDVLGAQTDGSGLAATLKPAVASVQIPEECQSWVPFFGEPAIRDLVSTEWKARESGLHAIIRTLQNAKFHATHDSGESFDASCAILCRALKDKVAPLYFAALEVFDAVLNAFSTQVDARRLAGGIDSFLIMLLNRCGNSNARISELSTQAIMSIAQKDSLGTAYLGPHLLAPLPPPKGGNAAAGSALLAGRLELIAALLVATQSSRGMTTEGMLAFCRPALELPEEKVRHAAIKTVVELYKLRMMAGDTLQLAALLPGLKPALLQVLQRKCEELCETSEMGPSATGRDEQPVGGNGGIQIMGKGMSALPPLSRGGGGGGSGFLPAIAGASLRSDGGSLNSRSALPPPSLRGQFAFSNGGSGGAGGGSGSFGGDMGSGKFGVADGAGPSVSAPMPTSPKSPSGRLRASPARARMQPSPLSTPGSQGLGASRGGSGLSKASFSQNRPGGADDGPPRSPVSPFKPSSVSMTRAGGGAGGAGAGVNGSGPRNGSRPRAATEPPRLGSPSSGCNSPKVLDDAEEQLLESIMTADARRL